LRRRHRPRRSPPARPCRHLLLHHLPIPPSPRATLILRVCRSVTAGIVGRRRRAMV
jgi:hypothetical protein